MSGFITDGRDGAIDFHHPYTPYDVQLQFMKAVYDTLEAGEGQIGILESPTGTGKSLSLICGALTWLRNHKRSRYEASCATVADQLKGEPEWIVEQSLRRKRDELSRAWQDREERLGKARLKEKMMEARGAKRRRLEGGPQQHAIKSADEEEAEFLLPDLSEDGVLDDDDPLALFSKETRDLMEKAGLAFSRPQETEEDGEVEDEIKIYYASRTHSQLTQFISELRRPAFPPSIPGQNSSDKEAPAEGVKHIPLSSRQKLCINPSVARLGSVSAINDRCAEMQQSKSKDKKCKFVPNAENLKATHAFRDAALATLPDIEDTYQIGKQLHVCPYYASRTAIPGAEVITLPYPLLLQESAREALGIKLEGNVVIIDEAHNIMDAVASVQAAEIRLTELKKARQMLGIYVKRFGKKLKGENRVMVAHIVKVVDSLTEWLDGGMANKSSQGIVDPNQLLKARGADQINLYGLIRYIQESKLAYKIESYAVYTEEKETAAKAPVPATPALHTLVAFLRALTNLSTEGRVFYEKLPSSPPDIKLSYLLLSPTHAFSAIATRARAVILAGGTMSPFDDYKAHLFPYLSPGKITTLSCGHVIPPSNLCVWTLASTRPSVPGARSADEFEFSFQKRSDKGMIRQLGLALLNVCSVVPDGVVIFFPSYGYLDEVVGVWQSPSLDSGPGAKSLWERLGAKKALFRETKAGASDQILQEYSEAILGPGEPGRPKGALLLSVVGGKMSEGINFSDRLGRCVLIVGLPYPNANSPEWKARSEYIEMTMLKRLQDANGNEQSGRVAPQTQQQAVAASKEAAREFYENACMRAVNQSIGRAIRHQNDYASIILVDRRFSTERIRRKLPGWIRGGMVEGSENKGLQGMMGALNVFFRGKKEAAV